MFSRSNDRSTSADQKGGLQPVPGPSSGTSQSANAANAATAVSEETTVARGDRVEGTIKAQQRVRVLGQVQGKIEALTVIIEEGAKVNADVTADDVVVSGEYTGNLVCRGRLEVRPSGRISGRLETEKLMLHEGAAVDGEVHMIRPQPEEASVRGGIPIRAGSSDGNARQPVTPGGESIG